MAGVICVSCFNRQREVVKGRNGKGLFPIQAGSILRWGYALIQLPDAAAAVSKVTERHRSKGELWTSGLKANYLPGLPRIELLGDSELWFSAVVSGIEELNQIVSRMLPGAVIIDSEISASFADKWQLPTNSRLVTP